MATYIRKLKDLNGSYVLPETRSTAIYMSSNQKLEDYLTDMEDDQMRQISSGSVDFSRATASTSDVLSGETFYAGNKTLKTGTMTNRGTWSTTINPGASVTIPAGYHNGYGRVTANNGGTFHRIDCGEVSTRAATNTMDLKTKLPSMYNKITVDNIFCESVIARLETNYPDNRVGYSVNFSKTYDPSTGILSVPQTYWQVNNRLNGGMINCHVYVCYVD